MDGRCARLASGSERDSRDAVNGHGWLFRCAPLRTNLIARVSAGRALFFAVLDLAIAAGSSDRAGRE